MKEYRIEPVGGRAVPLCGNSAAGPWSDANILGVDAHPWRTGGASLSATLRSLYDEEALYLQYRVIDGAIRATERGLNGSVWRDSCVEFFASPHDAPDYINFETNCLGDFRLGCGPGRDDRRVIDPGLASAIHVETSVSVQTGDAAAGEWWLSAALPFETLGTFVGADIAPSAGTAWCGNVYCCREGAEPQYAVWNPVDAPEPDFHRSADFGRFVFG